MLLFSTSKTKNDANRMSLCVWNRVVFLPAVIFIFTEPLLYQERFQQLQWNFK